MESAGVPDGHWGIWAGERGHSAGGLPRLSPPGRRRRSRPLLRLVLSGASAWLAGMAVGAGEAACSSSWHEWSGELRREELETGLHSYRIRGRHLFHLPDGDRPGPGAGGLHRLWGFLGVLPAGAGFPVLVYPLAEGYSERV